VYLHVIINEGQNRKRSTWGYMMKCPRCRNGILERKGEVWVCNNCGLDYTENEMRDYLGQLEAEVEARRWGLKVLVVEACW
jgi:uncharacterized protein (DUF983 family)